MNDLLENKLLLKKLNNLLNYISKKSPFYKKVLEKREYKLKNLIDFKELPFTTKNNIANSNNDFLCVPMKDVREFVTTSGTLGNPISFFLTENDLNRLAINEEHSLSLCNINTGSRVLLTTTLDKCFIAGLAYYMGCQRLGLGVIRIGPGNATYQLDMINRFEPQVIITVPSFLLKIINYAEKNNIVYPKKIIEKVICIGEPIRNKNFDLNKLGLEITSKLDAKLYSTYASTEMMTAFTECSQGNGGHLQENLLYVEVLDDSDQDVIEGEYGEVVITTFDVEAMPLLRYRTGDICRVYRKKCDCGRSSLRLGPILGRKNQRLKIKGTTIFPQAIINAIREISTEYEFVIEIYTDKYAVDQLIIYIDKKINTRFNLKTIKNFLKSKLLFTPSIKFLTESEIKSKIEIKSLRKKANFIDLRKKDEEFKY